MIPLIRTGLSIRRVRAIELETRTLLESVRVILSLPEQRRKPYVIGETLNAVCEFIEHSLLPRAYEFGCLDSVEHILRTEGV